MSLLTHEQLSVLIDQTRDSPLGIEDMSGQVASYGTGKSAVLPFLTGDKSENYTEVHEYILAVFLPHIQATVAHQYTGRAVFLMISIECGGGVTTRTRCRGSAGN